MKLVVRHLEPNKIIVYLGFVFCKKKRIPGENACMQSHT